MKSVQCNQWTLEAKLEEISPLRFTPAGLPAVNVVLAHASHQLEAGGYCEVALSVRAVALGTLAERLYSQKLGIQARFTGFLKPSRAGAKQLVFHIQEFVLH